MKSSASGRSASACHTRIAGVPETASSATARSRSQFEPGKVTTAERKAILLPFDAIVLDHHVGELLAAHLVELAVGHAVVDIERDQPPGAHVVHALEPKSLQRMMDRAALRIEHSRLEADVDLNFHLRPFAADGRGG